MIDALIDATDALLPKPYATFGYSLGSIVSIEFVRAALQRKMLLSSHEWVAWRVKCGLQPGEANT